MIFVLLTVCSSARADRYCSSATSRCSDNGEGAGGFISSYGVAALVHRAVQHTPLVEVDLLSNVRCRRGLPAVSN